MTNKVRLTAAALVSAVGLGLVAPTAAHAGRSGRRNTAIALGALSVYGIARRSPWLAAGAGAGALYSYSRSRSSDGRKHRGRYRRARSYNRGYYRPSRYSRYNDYDN